MVGKTEVLILAIFFIIIFSHTSYFFLLSKNFQFMPSEGAKRVT